MPILQPTILTGKLNTLDGQLNAPQSPVYQPLSLPQPISISYPPSTISNNLQILTVNINSQTDDVCTISVCPVDISGSLVLSQIQNIVIKPLSQAAANDQNVAQMLDDIYTVIYEYATNNNLYGLNVS